MPVPFTKSIASLVSLAALSIFCPAFASEQTVIYVCTPDGVTPDASSRYINFDGALAINLLTAQDGNSIAGINLTGIPAPPNAFGSLQFFLTGNSPHAEHGPYLIMEGWDRKGSPETKVVGLGAVKPAEKFQTILTYVIKKKDLNITGKQAFFPTHMFIQSYPGSNGPSQFVLWNFIYNGQTFSSLTGEQFECPGPTAHP
jgi:hypothetical protein